MGKSSGSAPAAPDPAKTAAAQTATNKETALWNAVLNNVNQITPYGTLNYTQTGGGKKYDDAGYTAAQTAYANQQASLQEKLNDNSEVVRKAAQRQLSGLAAPKRGDYLLSDAPPTFTSEIKLSPEQQALYDTQTRSDNALASLGEGQIGRITDSVSTPFSYSGIADGFTEADTAAASQRGEQAILSRLDPRFAQDEESLRTRLINQGIGQGSEAYRREMEQFNQTKTDARNQAIIQGANYGGTLQEQALQRRNQGINEYTTQRNAPLNEYIGLTSGSQVQNPTFNNTNYQGAQSVDYAGLVNNQYQQQLAQYNAKQAGSNSLMGGLFGLGGSALSGFAGSGAGSAAIAGLFAGSDINIKENIVHVGEENGHKVYDFNYLGDDVRYRGVMAQDVEKTHPEAVKEINGIKHVNYDAIGVKMRMV